MYDMKRWHQDSILVLDNDPEVEDSIQFNIQPRFSFSLDLSPFHSTFLIFTRPLSFSLDLSHFHSTFLIFTRPLPFSLNLSHFHLTFLIFTRPFSFSLDLSQFHSTSLTPIFTRPFSFHSTFLISLDLSHFHSTRPAFRALFKSMFAGARQCGWWTEVAWLDLFNIHWLGAALFRTGISATMSTKS